MTTLNELYSWMKRHENGQLEFKEAKNNFDITKLVRYCCAFANEGSGRIILGITDQLPRKIVGSQAFLNLEQIKSYLIGRLSLRIEVKELLLKHIRTNKTEGARLSDLCQVLPALSERQVQTLLLELKIEELIHVRGKTKGALWFPGKEILEAILG